MSMKDYINVAENLTGGFLSNLPLSVSKTYRRAQDRGPVQKPIRFHFPIRGDLDRKEQFATHISSKFSNSGTIATYVGSVCGQRSLFVGVQ